MPDTIVNRSNTYGIATLPQAVCKGGNRTKVSSNNFPILKGMAWYILRLERGGIREPHWHPNAAELSYCVRGKPDMTIFGPDACLDNFTVDQGEIVFVLEAIFTILKA
jgi:oxalate decarboxylase